MFGQNRPRGPNDVKEGQLQVHEIFYTLQGEGPFSGHPAVFVRLSGCNLRCWFCFAPTTFIDMGDGSKKRISDIKVNDEVMSWDNGFVKKKVTKVFESEAQSLLRVEAGTKKWWVTPEHPFLTKDGWVEAKNLKSGMNLVHFSPSEKMKLFNPGKLSTPTEEERTKAKERLIDLWKDETFRSTNVERMKTSNPMKDPEVAARSFSHRNNSMSGYEKAVLKACEGLPIEFLGNTLEVSHKFPDFKVIDQDKLIEVWAADADFARERNASWIAARAERFSKAGYDTLFLPLTSIDLRSDNISKVRDKVAAFISNGLTITSVKPVCDKGYAALYGSATAPRIVYNFEVEDTHTYVANKAVVHNCDTKWDDDNDPYCYPEQIVANVKAIQGRARLVVLTGGEPLRQDVTELCGLLNAAGFTVQIETAGTYWQEVCRFGDDVYTVVSPKNGRVHPNFKLLHNYVGKTGLPLAVWKYVVKAGEVAFDGLPIGNFQRLKNGSIGGGELERPPAAARVYLQPCDEYDDEKNKANYAAVAKSCLEHGYIGGVQVHKHLNLE